ncbi:hypothetical protein CHS0354_034099 [Potamilus streckersoni]|uniref:Uncharacterized protein n=1 Tax=Potamilus streckersoni TaxID=2493646 RepID=A0AAE0WAI7_9BIVA|nr:hypothetical protein CHS0354_034099 [Potamilus streckersoni]
MQTESEKAATSNVNSRKDDIFLVISSQTVYDTSNNILQDFDGNDENIEWPLSPMEFKLRNDLYLQKEII